VRRQASTRKPPPRVDSTQPRETSPEPSSSGEETAGEERFSVPPPEVINNGNGNHNWPINGTVPIVPTADDDPDWIDEQEECDDDDLLELEYHPNYISNVEKRRRKWEMGWEALVQAVSFFRLPFFFERMLIFLSSSKTSIARPTQQWFYSPPHPTAPSSIPCAPVPSDVNQPSQTQAA